MPSADAEAADYRTDLGRVPCRSIAGHDSRLSPIGHRLAERRPAPATSNFDGAPDGTGSRAGGFPIRRFVTFGPRPATETNCRTGRDAGPGLECWLMARQAVLAGCGDWDRLVAGWDGCTGADHLDRTCRAAALPATVDGDCRSAQCSGATLDQPASETAVCLCRSGGSTAVGTVPIFVRRKWDCPLIVSAYAGGNRAA